MTREDIYAIIEHVVISVLTFLQSSVAGITAHSFTDFITFFCYVIVLFCVIIFNANLFLVVQNLCDFLTVNSYVEYNVFYMIVHK